MMVDHVVSMKVLLNVASTHYNDEEPYRREKLFVTVPHHQDEENNFDFFNIDSSHTK